MPIRKWIDINISISISISFERTDEYEINKKKVEKVVWIKNDKQITH